MNPPKEAQNSNHRRDKDSPYTLHGLVTLCVVRRGRRVRLLRRWRVDRVRRWRRLRVVLHPGRRSRLGDPDRRLRKRPGTARRGPEGAVLVLRLRRRRRRVPVGGGGGVRPAGLPVGVRHLAAHGWTGSCGGKGLLGLGIAEGGRGRGGERKERDEGVQAVHEQETWDLIS